MSKQSKARAEAFRAAAEHMRTRDLYETSEDYGWNLIWDAARRWTVKQWRAKVVEIETHLIAARHSAGVVQRAVSSLEASVAGRDEDIKRLTSNLEQTTATAKLRLGRIQEQERSIHLSMTANTALRTELDRLKAESVEIATRHLDQAVGDRNEALNKIMRLEASVLDQKVMIRNLRQEIDTLRPLTTSGAKEAYQNVERLARELAATKDALILAEDEGRDLREKLSQCREEWQGTDARNKGLRDILAEEKALTGFLRAEVQRLEGMRDSQGAALRSCMQKRDQFINENAILGDRIAKLTEPQPHPVICPVTKGGHIHKCVEEHAEPFRIAPHACSCGHRWYSPEQRTRR